MPRINVYVPDDLAEELAALPPDTLNISAVCQFALRQELALNATIDNAEHTVFELHLEDRDGVPYVGRLTGICLDEDAYLTAEGKIVLHDERNGRLDIIENVEDLRDHVDEDTYIKLAHGLGITPVVDLDL